MMTGTEINASPAGSPGGREEGAPSASGVLGSSEREHIEREIEARVRKEMEEKRRAEEIRQDRQTQVYQLLMAKEMRNALRPVEMPPLNAHVTANRYLAEIGSLPAFSNADDGEKVRMVIKASQKCATMGPKLLQWKTRAGLTHTVTWASLRTFLLKLQQEQVDDGIYEDALNNVSMDFDIDGTLEGGASYIQKIWVLYYLQMESLEQSRTCIVRDAPVVGNFRDIRRYALKGLPPILLNHELYNPNITEARFTELINTSIRCQTQIAHGGRLNTKGKHSIIPKQKTNVKMEPEAACPVSEKEIAMNSKQKTTKWSRLETFGLRAPSAMKRQRDESDNDMSSDEEEENLKRQKSKE
jgi:hypothetical protein